MIQKIKLKLKNNSYEILVGCGILPQLGAKAQSLQIGRDACIITNRNIFRMHGSALIAGLKRNGFSVKVFEVPDSEKSKSIQTAFHLIKKIASSDVGKRIFIIAFGGGVVGDLAGYVAAAYKRGIPYLQVPTTFLAQIDSAIGGKVGIDLESGKNLVGAFYQPKLVWSDVSLLKTLNQRQLKNGLAEAVKYGAIEDKQLFSYLEKNFNKILSGNAGALRQAVLRCSKIKAGIVSLDESEIRGIRTKLNFGHTLGHAIETAGGYHLYHHGEAIALGMRIAAFLSCRLRLLSEKDNGRLNRLLSNIGLPSKVKRRLFPGILKAMMHDKKFISGRNRFVLLAQIGKVKVLEGISLPLIKEAIREQM